MFYNSAQIYAYKVHKWLEFIRKKNYISSSADQLFGLSGFLFDNFHKHQQLWDKTKQMWKAQSMF